MMNMLDHIATCSFRLQGVLRRSEQDEAALWKSDPGLAADIRSEFSQDDDMPSWGDDDRA